MFNLKAISFDIISVDKHTTLEYSLGQMTIINEKVLKSDSTGIY